MLDYNQLLCNATVSFHFQHTNERGEVEKDEKKEKVETIENGDVRMSIKNVCGSGSYNDSVLLILNHFEPFCNLK